MMMCTFLPCFFFYKMCILYSGLFKYDLVFRKVHGFVTMVTFVLMPSSAGSNLLL